MSNLLDKASIVTTPTAYDNGKILSVKPAPSLGSELITNGDFTNGSTGWTLGSGWSIGAGVANASGSVNANISQNSFLTIGSKYEVTYTVLNASTGARVGLAPNGSTVQNIRTENGTYTEIYEAVNASFYIRNLWNNGVGLSITNVSVKQVIDGDFDFTRNSSATRVNSQGLIEDVQILSSNLVTNGDFSQEGSEEVTNGDFSNGSTDWNSEQGIWTFGDSVVNGNGANGSSEELTQSAVTTVGKNYNITYEVLNYVSGSVQILGSEIGYVSGNGVYTSYYSASSSTLKFRPINFNGSITNVSVKEVGQDWTLGTGWSIGANQLVRAVAVSGSYAQTSYDLGVIGRLYKISINVAEVLSGTLYVYGGLGGTPALTITSAGVYTINHIWASDQPLGVFCNNSFTGSISNISVIEITDDTNLPRIDYTGGEGHWLFEPQSTNLVTYSEVYGSGTYFSSFQGSTFDNTTSLSPSGENNATQLTSTGAGKLQTSGISLSQNTDYTLSFYAKNVDATEVTSRVLGLGGSGGGNLTPISYFSELSTTEWKRITHSFNTGTNTTFYLYLSNALNSGGTIQIWGAQLEQSSFATSYIPTSGSTVTRLQDAAFGAGSSDLINSTEGVLYAEIAALANGGVGDRYISLGSGSDVTNTVQLLYHNTANRINFRVTKGGSFQVNISDFTFEQTENLKIAVKFKANDFALWINGVKRVTDTSGQTFDVGTLQKLQFDSGNRASDFFGKTKCVAVFKEALTDAELTCLTTI